MASFAIDYNSATTTAYDANESGTSTCSGPTISSSDDGDWQSDDPPDKPLDHDPEPEAVGWHEPELLTILRRAERVQPRARAPPAMSFGRRRESNGGGLFEPTLTIRHGSCIIRFWKPISPPF